MHTNSVLVKDDPCDEGAQTKEEVLYLHYIEILDEPEYELNIWSVEGNGTYLCTPVIEDSSLSVIEHELIIRDIVDEIADNSDSFVFIPKNKAFGINKVKPEVGLADAMHTDFPITISDRQDVYESLKIGKITSHITFRLPLETKVSNNLHAEDIVHNHFVDYMSENATNEIVDMEKDVYYPVRYDSEVVDKCGYNNEHINITEVRFNMHFRTRNLDNWKIYDELTTNNTDLCNWFVTDYKYYSDKCDVNYLQNSSDLVGLMNFTTSEVANQAKKIGRSFLRVSYYSTDDPETQVLLGTSTIYLDERTLLKKYLTMNTMGMIAFAEVDKYQALERDSSDKFKLSWTTTECEAHSEIIGNKYMNDNLRLSSRLVVTDKYDTDTSAEGFYIYMFKEYSRLNHVNTIYARFEFNHAGIGQSIPMMIPRKNIGITSDFGELMKISNDTDLANLKKGFPMSDIYKQMYFPIQVKYDADTNRYVYWINHNLLYNNNSDKNVMEFNMFEIKFKDESFNESN